MSKSIEEMTDEEILAMNPPDIVEEDNKQVQEDNKPQEDNTPEDEPVEDTPSEGEPEPTEDNDEGSEEPPKEDKELEPKEGEEKNPSGSEPKEESAPEIDYKKFYEAMMSPIKANGRTFQPRTPEEAIRMMQMGANYTRKMQSLAPYRKKIQMLQNAGLLEDEKLNYLIDLSQGNQEAIKKLLKDSKLDPLDINVTEESQYTPGNHTVSDAEVQFQTAVDDLKSTPEGLETLRLIQGWDQASLEAMWKTPSMMATLNEQRQNGVYDLITKEMEHQRMLGNIPEGTPFLEAYKAVGEYCLRNMQAQQQQRLMANLPQGTLNQQKANNNAQVKKAAPSGRSNKTVSKFIDPFSLSDEEFEKQFNKYN